MFKINLILFDHNAIFSQASICFDEMDLKGGIWEFDYRIGFLYVFINQKNKFQVSLASLTHSVSLSLSLSVYQAKLQQCCQVLDFQKQCCQLSKYRNLPEIFQKYSRNVSEILQKSSRNLLKIFQKSSRNLPEIYQSFKIFKLFKFFNSFKFQCSSILVF